ncbi:MAG: type II toxin-antitoxin system VapC family toxin [Chloroflexi bacterium]|nr:type II toxin-antitoxin system VapC family toxin [Chloroflexota bacterium]
MGRLTAAIPPAALVAIDTVVFIYHIEATPAYQHVVGPFFEALARGDFRAVTSVISLMEVAVRPLQLQRPEVADDYERLLLNYPNLSVVEVDRHVARRAAELRARLRLRPADSLQIATALEAGADAFVTNDHALRGLPDLQVLVLDAFLATG